MGFQQPCLFHSERRTSCSNRRLHSYRSKRKFLNQIGTVLGYGDPTGRAASAILGGRASDTAIFSTLPLLEGISAGITDWPRWLAGRRGRDQGANRRPKVEPSSRKPPPGPSVAVRIALAWPSVSRGRP